VKTKEVIIIKSKTIQFLIISLCIIAFFSILITIYIARDISVGNKNIVKVKEKVEEYLYSKKGYSQDAIKEISVSYFFSRKLFGYKRYFRG